MKIENNKNNIIKKHEKIFPCENENIANHKKNINDSVNINSSKSKKIDSISDCETDPGPVPEGLKVYTKGNPKWVNSKTKFGLCLTGGGPESDEAMKWMINRSGNGDLVVLRIKDNPEELTNDNSLTNYLYKLGNPDSITTLIVDTNDKANLPYVEKVLKNAECLWIAGGNQANVFRNWKNSKLEKAVNYLANEKKIPIGGTSAGMQCLGSVIYSPEEGYNSVISEDALYDPYLKAGDEPSGRSSGVTLEKGIFNLPFLKNTVLETHLSERHRLGRTLVFLARMIKDHLTDSNKARAIANDEGTSVVIDDKGIARVFGNSDNGSDDYAYFIIPKSPPNICKPNKSLDWYSKSGSLDILKIEGTSDGRNTVDINSWITNDGKRINMNIDNGYLTEDIETPE